MSADVLAMFGIAPEAVEAAVQVERTAFYKKQGWDDETMAKYGLTICPNSTEGHWDARYKPQLQGYNYVDIPYFGLDHEPLMCFPARAGVPIPFRRARLLSFKGQSGKYQSYPGSGVRIYLPYSTDAPDRWVDAAFDVSVPVCITEGEFDSIVACEHGLLCLGLSGVDCLMQKGGSKIAEPLEHFRWENREVRICFDQDAELEADEHFKPSVLAGLERLTLHLTQLGANVKILFITQTALGRSRRGEKLGLTEYFVLGGTVGELLATATAADDAPGMVLAQYLLRYAMHFDTVVDLETGASTSFRTWASQHANVWVPVGEKRKPVPEVWKVHKQRRTISRYVFESDSEPGLGSGKTASTFNTWRGWGTQPGPWEESDGSLVEAVGYFEEWSVAMWGRHWPWVRGLLCHLTLKPDVLRPHCLVLQTPLKGIGKSSWYRLIRLILDNGRGLSVEGKQELVTARFNGLLADKLLVQLDEVYIFLPAEVRMVIQLITSNEINIERKGMEMQVRPWRGVLLMTTNEPFAIKTGTRERRVMQVSPTWSNTEALEEWKSVLADVIYPALFGSAEDDGSAARAAIMGYLSDPRWLDDYDHTRPAPQTESLVTSAQMSKTEREELAEDMFMALPDVFVVDSRMATVFRDGNRMADKYTFDKLVGMCRSSTTHIYREGTVPRRARLCWKTGVLPTRQQGAQWDGSDVLDVSRLGDVPCTLATGEDWMKLRQKTFDLLAGVI